MPGKTPYNMGEWLGELQGIKLKEAAKDADSPILELHGDKLMAAGEAPEEFVEALTTLAAELQIEHDRENGPSPERNRPEVDK
jgi:hypothetical protein